MKLDYDLISEYERYNLTADEETEMIIVNVYDVKTNTLKRKVELSKLKLMQLIKRYEKTDPDKITWYDRTLLEWGDSDKIKKKKRGTNPLSRLSFFYRTQTIVAIKSY